MSKIPGAALLLVLVLPVWGFGQYFAIQEGRKQAEPRAQRLWIERYEALVPHLQGVPRAGFVRHPETRPNHRQRFFRAQYVLAPTVLVYRYRLPRPHPQRLSGIPEIYDFADPHALDEILTETAARAEALGMSLERVPVGRGLVLTRMRKE